MLINTKERPEDLGSPEKKKNDVKSYYGETNTNKDNISEVRIEKNDQQN